MSKHRKSIDGVYPDDCRGGSISSTRALGQGFYVAGERHENLPAGGFAGLGQPWSNMRDMSSNSGPPGFSGTPVQSMWFVKQPFERTNAGDGQFGRMKSMSYGYADFGHGHGATRVGMGQCASACAAAAPAPSTLSCILSTAQSAANVASCVAALIPCKTAAAAAAKPATTSPFAFLTTAYLGLPLVVWAALPVAGYFVGKKAKWF